MPSYVMRVWLADRPGALGAVASRIGAVGGDVTGIDILERGDDRVIDELTIDLPSEQLIPLMLAKIRELDAVDVEDVRRVVGGLPHPNGDALEVASGLVACRSIDTLFEVLVEGIGGAFSTEWAAAVELDGPTVVATTPSAPPGPWIEAFVTGTRSAAADPGSAATARDVAWASLEASGVALLAGRGGRPFRAREKRQLATLAHVADLRWRELTTRKGAGAHPASSL